MEDKFRKEICEGGVGAIISSHVPIHVSGRVLPNYAFIDSDDKIDFWKRLKLTLPNDCPYILQLSYSGRQRDLGGIENLDKEPFNWQTADHGRRLRSPIFSMAYAAEKWGGTRSGTLSICSFKVPVARCKLGLTESSFTQATVSLYTIHKFGDQ
jgi:hypothetical protein